MSLFNNIFSGNATKEETKQQQTNVAVSEKTDNREKILEFKEAIKNAVEEQKGIKKITRAPHTNYSLVWPKQSAEIENRQWLFKAYTAYYIVKHYLWTDKDRMNEYIEKVVSDAKRALKGSDDWSDKWLKNKFREGVEDLVNAYIPVE